ncbi:MAG: peptidoglycan DD-metalloendopeptidase family protein [Prolixibacteraceae bacterium]
MKRFFLSILPVFFVMACLGQSMSELRKQKENAAEAIRLTSTLLEEARKNEKTSLNKLNLIGRQIENRNLLIRNINAEYELLDTYVSENTAIVKMLQRDLAELKKEYASMVRFAQKSKNSNDVLVFLFSAENLNQAYRRLLYLRQYTKYRKTQVEAISALSGLIDNKAAELEKQKQQKLLLIRSKQQENRTLEREKSEQSQSVAVLRQKQQDLRKKLKEQERVQNELNRAIEKLLQEEVSKRGGKEEFRMTPEQKLLAADFAKNKGRIPWPVERGIITERFGVHPHPLLKQITIKNNGIDISTRSGSKARAVFAGEVSRVFAISGGNMAVIIRHGTFLTVYSNLKEVYVKAGQKVSLKQEIGSIFTDGSDGNKTVLKFQVWKENQKLDPQDWISR